MTETINYSQKMHDALRGLLADVLRDAAENGLPGEHHFYITFETHFVGVKIADWLVERYPDEMTIVLQEWFKDLTVTNSAFSVTLNFGDVETPMYIPFDAVRAFVDPSVDFGLRFEVAETDENTESPMIELDNDAIDERDKKSDAEVVSLDSFRK